MASGSFLRLYVLELVAHHVAQDSAPAMCGQDSHDRYARGSKLATGHRHAEGERRGRSDDVVTVERGDSSVQLGNGAEASRSFLRALFAESRFRCINKFGEPLLFNRADLVTHRHFAFPPPSVGCPSLGRRFIQL